MNTLIRFFTVETLSAPAASQKFGIDSARCMNPAFISLTDTLLPSTVNSDLCVLTSPQTAHEGVPCMSKRF